MLKKMLSAAAPFIPYKVRRAFSLVALDDSAKFGSDSIYIGKYAKVSLKEKRFYNFGGGGFRQPYWSNIEAKNSYDKVFTKNVDIDFDFTSRCSLPVSNGSAEICYTSHVIEHLRDNHVAHIFSEAYRILKPGGLFRVTCPNVAFACSAVESNDLDFFKVLVGSQKLSASLTVETGLAFYVSRQLVLPGVGYSSWALPPFKELAKEKGWSGALTYLCSLSSDEFQASNPVHINWWDENKVIDALSSAGFSQVYISAFGQSRALVMRDTNLFDSTWPHISLYVEARK